MEHKQENSHMALISEGKYKGLMAHYEPEKIWGADFPDMGTAIYIMEVSINGFIEKPMLPIFMFDFTKEQKEEILLVKKNISLDNFKIPDGLTYIHVSTKENMERILGPLDERPPKKGNHSSLVDDLHVGKLIDAIIELKEGS